MNSSQINAEQKAVNVMESIVAHDFSKVIKSYKKEHKANDEEAEFVLTQLQRWLTLCIVYPEKQYIIGSKVDAMWHNFILFTKDYERFCKDVAGFFIHHLPDVEAEGQGDIEIVIGEKNKRLETLEKDYEKHFGHKFPIGVWPTPMYHKKEHEGCNTCQMPPPCARCSVGMP